MLLNKITNPNFKLSYVTICHPAVFIKMTTVICCSIGVINTLVIIYIWWFFQKWISLHLIKLENIKEVLQQKLETKFQKMTRWQRHWDVRNTFPTCLNLRNNTHDAALKRKSGNQFSPDKKQKKRIWWIFILNLILLDNRTAAYSTLRPFDQSGGWSCSIWCFLPVDIISHSVV